MTTQEKIIEKLKNLIFTASNLWDKVKPIKDTEFMTVTHPIIEEAKELLAALESQQAEKNIIEKTDENLLQDIYDRNDAQVICNSDIYLRGFDDGLAYKTPKKDPWTCPDCGNSVYNCKCQ